MRKMAFSASFLHLTFMGLLQGVAWGPISYYNLEGCKIAKSDFEWTQE